MNYNFVLDKMCKLCIAVMEIKVSKHRKQNIKSTRTTKNNDSPLMGGLALRRWTRLQVQGLLNKVLVIKSCDGLFLWNKTGLLKVFFFQKELFVFQISKSPKKYSKKTILNLKFKIPAHNSSMFWAGILNFKFRIVFGIFSFGDSEIWKKELNFLKKATFRQFYYCFVFKIFNFLKLQLCTGQNVHVMLCIALMVIAQYRTYIEWLCC